MVRPVTWTGLIAVLCDASDQIDFFFRCLGLEMYTSRPSAIFIKICFYMKNRISDLRFRNFCWDVLHILLDCLIRSFISRSVFLPHWCFLSSILSTIASFSLNLGSILCLGTTVGSIQWSLYFGSLKDLTCHFWLPPVLIVVFSVPPALKLVFSVKMHPI